MAAKIDILIIEDELDHSERLRDFIPNKFNVYTISKPEMVKPYPVVDKIDQNIPTYVITTFESHVDEDGKEHKTSNKILINPKLIFFDYRFEGRPINGINLWEEIGKPQNYLFVTIWAAESTIVHKFIQAGIEIDRVISKEADKNEMKMKIQKYLNK
ncbi:hypothetical protein MHK_004287 [Candidatus Magnetomorum sp. HK-1]|nr:hypothetical protein MHK_004287 [Candidatus Magnetomorum sp. HK-1]